MGGVCASRCVRSDGEIRFLTKAGNVPIQSDIFKVPLCCSHLRGVGLRHVIHGKHVFLTELSVVIKVDLSIKANHYGKGWVKDSNGGKIEQVRKRKQNPDIKKKNLITISKT